MKKTCKFLASPQRVGFLKRGVALVLDMYLASILAHIPVLIIYSLQTGETQMTQSLIALDPLWGMVACILAIGMVFFYYIGLPLKKWPGQTPMKRLLGIQVVSKNNFEKPLTWQSLVKREALGVMVVEGGLIISGEYFRQFFWILTQQATLYQWWTQLSFGVTLFSIALATFHPRGCALHDLIAGTQVIALEADASEIKGPAFP